MSYDENSVIGSPGRQFQRILNASNTALSSIKFPGDPDEFPNSNDWINIAIVIPQERELRMRLKRSAPLRVILNVVAVLLDQGGVMENGKLCLLSPPYDEGNSSCKVLPIDQTPDDIELEDNVRVEPALVVEGGTATKSEDI
ncbi:unnamed protein product [Mesocestoides corti]|uniref:CUB domain-containing protein n=1 Tax=Mesocestoides corti TaxID=53468 RepID=A0A0R3U947_MESCO|nr:unnamed protein product [Mesocestoides corti]